MGDTSVNVRLMVAYPDDLGGGEAGQGDVAGQLDVALVADRRHDPVAFSLGPLEDKDIESLASVIAKLVSGEVIRPDEAWIREYLGLPTAAVNT